MQLYRPVGLHELQLIYESGMRAFPRRLPDQPIFYPVLNFAYAAQIASTWNTKSNSFAGYVTEFHVDDTYIAHYERQVVGARMHEELWIPAEQLPIMNQHIQAPIMVSAAYFGQSFRGYQPTLGRLMGHACREQFALLVALWNEDRAAFAEEVRTNHLAVYLHYRFWEHDVAVKASMSEHQQRDVLIGLQTVWREISRIVPLMEASVIP
jgi:hypothetical protein